MKAIYESVPFTSVCNLTHLSKGAHIKVSKSHAQIDHAIVTDINVEKSVLTFIKCSCKDINNKESVAEIKEETITFDEDKDEVFLVNYKDSHRNQWTPNFTPMPKEASAEVARYFKDHSADFKPELMKDCEHFAFCCTLGYPINLQEMKQLVIAFGALKMFDKSSISETMDHMTSKRLAKYEKGADHLTVMLQSGEPVNISFSKPFKKTYVN